MASTRTRRDPQTVGPYVILSRLGTGGAGTVYRARDRKTGDVVAVKVLAADLSANPKLHYRFVQEFKSAAKLDHPNIVRALDFGVYDSRAYLTMELVDGVDLADVIDSTPERRLPEATAVRIAAQVAQGLHYAHRQRIIHRDVKPQNVLVRADGMAKLTDFGLAKDYNDDHDFTRPASGLGTPPYMAPEQWQSAKTAGVACDVYSLGATLYTMVTGVIPFADCPAHVALGRKLKGDLPPPRKLVPEVSEQVDAAIRAAMNPDPAKRPATCLALAKMLPFTVRPHGAGSGPWGAGRPAATPAPARPADRRAAVRYVCNLGTGCVIETAVAGGGDESREEWPTTVQDVSAGGVGLVLGRRFEPGTLLSVELSGGGRPRTCPARVVRVSPAPPGHWFHGCRFDPPLTAAEFQTLFG